MTASFCDYCQQAREPVEALAVLYRLLGKTEEADRCESALTVGLVWRCRSCGVFSTDPIPTSGGIS